MTAGQRFGVVILSALAALCSLGILAAPVSRLLISRFKCLNTSALPTIPAQTHQIAQNIIVTSSNTQKHVPIPVATSTSTPASALASAPVAASYAPASATAKTHALLQPPTATSQPIPTQVASTKSNAAVPKTVSNPALIHSSPTTQSTIRPPSPYTIHFDDDGISKTLFDESIGYKYSLPDPNNLKSTTKVKRALIENRLRVLGKTCGESADNGDCFLHSFAQSYNYWGNSAKPVTVYDLRCILKQKVNSVVWLESWFDENNLTDETLWQYKANVGFCGGSGRTKPPSWGYPTREGQILCQHFKVNLKVYTADIQGITATTAGKLLANKTDLENYVKEGGETQNDVVIFGEDHNSAITIPGATKTVEMVVYPQHYLPVFDQI